MAITTFNRIQRLVSMIRVKIAKMILIAITTFPLDTEYGAPRKHFLEGKTGFCWDLYTEQPSNNILLQLYAQVQYLLAHFLVTFEEAFYISYFYCYI